MSVCAMCDFTTQAGHTAFQTLFASQLEATGICSTLAYWLLSSANAFRNAKLARHNSTDDHTQLLPFKTR